MKRLSCGVEHSLVLGHCGEVYLWGTGSEGQLGMGPNVSELLKPTVLQVCQGYPVNHGASVIFFFALQFCSGMMPLPFTRYSFTLNVL